MSITYDKNKISTEKINSILKKYRDGRYEFRKFIDEYNDYMESVKDFESFIKRRKKEKPGAITPNQKDMTNYLKEIKELVQDFNPKGSGLNKKEKGSIASRAKGEGLKILTIKQMLNRYLYYSLKYKQEIIQIN